MQPRENGIPAVRSPSSAVLIDPEGERLVTCHADVRTPDDASFLPARLPQGTSAVLADVAWVTGARRLLSAAREARVPGVIDGDRVVDDKSYFDLASHVAFSAATVRALTGADDPAEGLAALAGSGSQLALRDGWRARRLAHGGRRDRPCASLCCRGRRHARRGRRVPWSACARARRRHGGAPELRKSLAALECLSFGGGRIGAPTRTAVEAFIREQGEINELAKARVQGQSDARSPYG